MSGGVTRRGFVSTAFPIPALLATFASTPVRAQAQQSPSALKLSLDGRIDGTSAPFFVALERGHFQSEGLEVSIEPSAGGVEPITRAASGAFDIAVADINTYLRVRDQNANVPVKTVFVVNNRPSYAIVGRRSRGVSAPGDLADKRLGAPAAEAASAAWPIFARLNGVNAGTVRVVGIGLPVREPMLAAGEVDAVTGASHGVPITLREKGVPADDITTLLMAQYGLELYGMSIIANARVLAERPDAVRGFLRALTLGLKETVRDPAAALPTVLRRMTSGNREIELERLQVLIRDSVVTPEVTANGLGAADPARLETAIEQLNTAAAFKTKPRAADVFDPSFLPPEADRRIG